MSAMPSCLRFDRHATWAACRRAIPSDGNNNAVRTPTMAITVSSSTRVKALLRRMVATQSQLQDRLDIGSNDVIGVVVVSDIVARATEGGVDPSGVTVTAKAEVVIPVVAPQIVAPVAADHHAV